MNSNVRRFTAALSLTLVLTATLPAAAAPSPEGRERTSIARIIKRVLERIFGGGVTTHETPTTPIPEPIPPAPPSIT